MIIHATRDELNEHRRQMANWNDHQDKILAEAEAAAKRLKHRKAEEPSRRTLEVELPCSPDESGDFPSASGEFRL